MNKTQFFIVNMIVTTLEYYLIYYICNVLLDNQSLSIIITISLLTLSMILYYILNKSGVINSNDYTEEEINEVYSEYAELIQKAETLSGKSIQFGLVDNKNIMAAAMEYNDVIYVNKAFPIRKYLMEGVIAHELGHVISGSSKKILVAQIRVTVLLAGIVKFIGGALSYSNNGFSKSVRVVVYIVYMALNAINLIILFPFMKREEYIANSNAIKLGAGDSLRCYYYSNIYKRSGNLDLFDLSHPKINDMLHAMNTEMNLVHDYETDVYAVDGVIHYVSNTKDKIEKDVKTFNWYIHTADRNTGSVQNTIGLMYYRGIGTEKSIDDAIIWFKKAAENDIIVALYNIGRMYSELEEFELAIPWYEQAISKDYRLAYIKLGEILEKNEDTISKAYELYYAGAKKGIKACGKKLIEFIKK